MVSIITPAFNAEQFIAKTITSVINQTYSNWELIIVDDGSTDRTPEIINSFLSDSRIKLIKHKTSLGPGIARNNAISAAKGQYIAFLDADDLWKPHKLNTQIDFMKKHNAAIVFSSYELINESGEPLNTVTEALPTLTYKKQLKCNYIGNLTGVYDTRVLGKIAMPEIKKRQDWVMWLEAIKKAGYAKGIKEPLAKYRVRKNSISSNKINLIKYNFNVYRKALGFGYFKSIYSLIVFFYEYFFVKSKQIKKIPSRN